MERPGRVPSETVLMAIAVVCKVEVWVHHGGLTTVVYKEEEREVGKDIPKIHLQCLAGIHFNPVETSMKPEEYEGAVSEDHVNVLQKQISASPTSLTEVQGEGSDDTSQTPLLSCSHLEDSNSRCKVRIGGLLVCALMDTGAQVNLIGADLCRKLLDSQEATFIAMERKVVGIGQCRTPVLGILTTSVFVKEVPIPGEVEFAVISEESLPGCCLLGAGFLEEHKVVLDYRQHAVYFGDLPAGCRGQANRELMMGRKNKVSPSCKVLGYVDLSDDEEPPKEVRYVVSQDTLEGLQSRDYAVRLLKAHVKRMRGPQEWKGRVLDRFKRNWPKYRLEGNLLVVELQGRTVPVLSFRAFVDACYQTHSKLAHLGRPKLLEKISQHFWHPAVHKVTRDVCTTCVFCQLHKPSPQRVSPPTIRIQSSGPFDLVALDLLQFTRSPRRHVAVLVAVDHFSKFAMASNLLDKTTKSVCHALKTHILPHMLRKPTRILTDNGPEFRSGEFKDLMEQAGVQLVHSTAYKASSNGAVERVNQTITRILKGLMGAETNSWDLYLPEAIRIYNDTMHSQLQCSPSEFLMKVAHPIHPNLGVGSRVLDTWKEGHPRFAAFRVNELVACSIKSSNSPNLNSGPLSVKIRVGFLNIWGRM